MGLFRKLLGLDDLPAPNPKEAACRLRKVSQVGAAARA